MTARTPSLALRRLEGRRSCSRIACLLSVVLSCLLLFFAFSWERPVGSLPLGRHAPGANGGVPRLCEQWGCDTEAVDEDGNWKPPRPELTDSARQRYMDLHHALRGMGDPDMEVAVIGGTEVQMWCAVPFPHPQSVLHANHDTWDKCFDSAANFGIGGDRAQDVGWRLENGLLTDDLDPLIFVVMVGREDVMAGESPTVVVAETVRIVRALQARRPESSILLVGVLPCKPGPVDMSLATIQQTQHEEEEGGEQEHTTVWSSYHSTLHDTVLAVNVELMQQAEKLGDMVTFVECSMFFLTQERDEQWTLSSRVMRDHHHLTVEGYRRLAHCLHLPLQSAHSSAMSRRFS